MADLFGWLADEVVLHVFSFFLASEATDVSDFRRVQQVMHCRMVSLRWNHLLTDEALWQNTLSRCLSTNSSFSFNPPKLEAQSSLIPSRDLFKSLALFVKRWIEICTNISRSNSEIAEDLMLCCDFVVGGLRVALKTSEQEQKMMVLLDCTMDQINRILNSEDATTNNNTRAIAVHAMEVLRWPYLNYALGHLAPLPRDKRPNRVNVRRVTTVCKGWALPVLEAAIFEEDRNHIEVVRMVATIGEPAGIPILITALTQDHLGPRARQVAATSLGSLALSRGCGEERYEAAYQALVRLVSPEESVVVVYGASVGLQHMRDKRAIPHMQAYIATTLDVSFRTWHRCQGKGSGIRIHSHLRDVIENIQVPFPDSL